MTGHPQAISSSRDFAAARQDARRARDHHTRVARPLSSAPLCAATGPCPRSKHRVEDGPLRLGARCSLYRHRIVSVACRSVSWTDLGQQANAASLESFINSLRCGSTRGLSCVDDGNRVRGSQRLARLHDRPMRTWKQTGRPTTRYEHSRGCSRDRLRASCSSGSQQTFTRIVPPMRAGNESRYIRPLLLREPARRIDR